MVHEENEIDRLNSLLRGEISAAQTYSQAIQKVEDGEHEELREGLVAILQDHGQHAQHIRDEIVRMGGTADKKSGGWGVYAKTVQGVSNVFGDSSALKSLKEGEEHGLEEYEEALEEMDDPPQMLMAELIVSQQRHVRILDAMINSVEEAVEMRA